MSGMFERLYAYDDEETRSLAGPKVTPKGPHLAVETLPTLGDDFGDLAPLAICAPFGMVRLPLIEVMRLRDALSEHLSQFPDPTNQLAPV